jgi:hypothetical protein
VGLVWGMRVRGPHLLLERGDEGPLALPATREGARRAAATHVRLVQLPECAAQARPHLLHEPLPL